MQLLKKNQIVYATLYHLRQKYAHTQNFKNIENKQKSLLKKVRDTGYVVIPGFVSKEFCNNCIRDIENMISTKKEYVHHYSDLRVFGAEELSDNIDEYAQHKFLMDFANNYNAEDTVNGFVLANKIEFSKLSSELGSGGGWHKDSVSRQVKSILYLNDVDENNGAYQIIEKSHKLLNVLSDMHQSRSNFTRVRFTDQQVEKILQKNPDRLKTLTGKAGTLILKDCSAIHRGSPLKEGKRYALTNYYFQRRKISPALIKHFSPIVSPEKVLKLNKNYPNSIPA